MAYSSTQAERPSYIHYPDDRLKIVPFKKRLADGEWPMAFAHYIPFFSVYYAFSRKTITPMVWQFGLNLITGLIVLLTNYEAEVNTATYGRGANDTAPFVAFVFFASLALDPVAVRLGIKNAKKDAYRRLVALGEIEGDIQQEQPVQQVRYSQPLEPQVTPLEGFQTRMQETMRHRNSKQVSPQPEWQETREKGWTSWYPEDAQVSSRKSYTPLEESPKDLPPQEAPKPAVAVAAPPAQKPAEVNESLEQKLLRLKQWAEQGLISEEEAKALRQKELGLQ